MTNRSRIATTFSAPKIRLRALLHAGIVALVALIPSLMWYVPVSASSTTAASLSQCTNGAVGPPLVKEQCAGSSQGAILNGAPNVSGFKNWVNGDANGQKAHWREGEFISYRTQLTVPAGANTLQIHYDTVHGGGHAIDYLGSYDATETTATTATAFHANYNNPCADLVAAGVMPSTDCPDDGTIPTPRASAPVPGATITPLSAQTCGGSLSSGTVSAGTFVQVPGSFKLFGPSGSTVGTPTYVSENVLAGSGQCSTSMSIPFFVGGSATTNNLVLAWGGHIADTFDWGQGNSAGGIQGSPYHMFLDNLDGNPGSQDRALASSAIFFPATIITAIKNASNVVVTSVSAGTAVHDTATLLGASPTAGGTVTYNYFSGSFNCTGTPVAETKTVTGGIVPDASSHTVGSTNVSFNAVYSGDAQDGAATSPCEPLTVLPAQIKVLKTADAASVSAGTPIGFTVTVENLGTGTATGVTLTDPLPGGNVSAPVTWSIDNSTGNPTSFALSGAAGSQSLSLAGQPITMLAGASLTVHVTAPTGSTSCATYSNTASAITTNDGVSQASASEAVLCATIHVAKIADATSVSAGTAIGFTVTVSNTGAGTATGVTLTDALPGGNVSTPVTWSIDQTTGNPSSFALSGAAGSQHLTLAGQPISMLAGTSLTVHVTAPTASTSCTLYHNTAGVTTSNDGSDSASADETVLCASIHVTKTADATSVSAGTAIGFTVTVSNTGAGTATGVTLTDALPGGNVSTPVTWSIDQTTGNPSSFALSGAAGSQQLTLAGQPISMASGASLTVHVTAPTTRTSCTLYHNTAGVTTGNDSSGSASADETVLCATIQVSKIADATSVSAGTAIGFTVTVSNTGAGTATGVTLTDALPGGNVSTPVTWSIDQTTGNPSSFALSGAAGSQQLTLAGQPISMLAGASLTVHVTAPTTRTSCTTYNNTATAATSNDGSSQASDSETVLCASIQVAKIADSASVSAGTPIGFTVTVSNTGAGTAAGVTLTDNLPGGNASTPVTWSIDQTTGNPSSFALSGAAGSQHLTLAGQPISMLAGASLTVHITAPTGSTSCTTYNNTASATTSNDGSGTASAAETVLCASIQVAKTADATSVSAGTAIGFTVTVSNTGAGTATGVTLTDNLPGGNASHPVTWSIDASTGNPSSFALSGAAGSQHLTLAGQPISMLAGTSLTVHITAPTGITSCTTYNNTASATSTNDGSGTASAAETVLCPNSSLAKAQRDVTTPDTTQNSGGFTAATITAHPSDVIEYRLTYTNAGPGTATNVSISDLIPTHTTFLSCSNSCTQTATAVTWALGTQAPGSVARTFQVTLDSNFAAGSTTQITNIATVTTAQEGSLLSNPVIATVFIPAQQVLAAVALPKAGGLFQGGLFQGGPARGALPFGLWLLASLILAGLTAAWRIEARRREE